MSSPSTTVSEDRLNPKRTRSTVCSCRRFIAVAVLVIAILVWKILRKQTLDVPYEGLRLSEADYTMRFRNLHSKMHKESFDLFLVSDPKSIFYLTGLSYKAQERPFFVIVSRVEGGEMPNIRFLVPQLEKEHVSRKSLVKGPVESYWEFPAPFPLGWNDKLCRRLDEILSASSDSLTEFRVAYEPSFSSFNFGMLKNVVDDCISSSSPLQIQLAMSDLLLRLRMVKSPTEISLIRKSAAYADHGVHEMVTNVVYNGITALGVFIGQKAFDSAVKTNELKAGTFLPLQFEILNFCFPAPYSAEPHGVPPLLSRLEGGPHVAMSYLRVNGFASESERTFFLSPPTPKEREVFQHMLEARELALAKVRAGVKASEVDRAAMEFLKAKGYGEYLLHRTGHGIGMDNHEGPWIAEGNDDLLEENMIISIEPGIYIPEVGGFRHSDTVLVTRDGYELLTKYPIDIDSLTFIRGDYMKKYVTGPLTEFFIGAKGDVVE